MAKKTSTALTVVNNEAPIVVAVPSLDELALTIREAEADFETHVFDSVQAAIRLGAAALQAKDQLPRGEFLPWIEKHCNKSQPWVAQCMNAARVDALLATKSQREQARLREAANSIEAFARLYQPLKAGDADPLQPTTKPATRKPRKADPAPQPAPWPLPAREVADDGIIDAEMPEARVDNVKADLAAQRAELDERERLLVLREAECAERERLLDEREADLRFREMQLAHADAGPATDVEVKEEANGAPEVTEEVYMIPEDPKPKKSRSRKAKAAEAQPPAVQ